MLTELHILHTYFEEPAGLLYEKDLARRFGGQAVREAVADGLIDRLYVPCAGGEARVLCRLSQAGRTVMRRTLGDH